MSYFDSHAPLREYRVFLADGRVIIDRAIGPSMIVAHYPTLWRFEDVAEVERREGGGFY